ncbi:flavin reductase family protein [Paeniglutamicibacter sp. NPDC012692]|uniref:flavin reductase family protein n=1 Tax=Paeniglutamicibacter sp. NPDC012692 TaxID=3364388 RepID=UPI0036772AA6
MAASTDASMVDSAAGEAVGQKDLRTLFVEAMGRTATGVTVVGTDGPAGRLAQTVSAMCSVSADPESLLVCVHRKSPLNEAIARHGVFSVSVLGVQHDHVADTFAGRPWPGKERWDFTCGKWVSLPSGSPAVEDALAIFDCSVRQVVECGSHFIYFGNVLHAGGQPGEPLTYHARTYGKPLPVPPSQFDDYPGSGPVR